MRPVILMLLDGWGWSKEKVGNSILSAKTPNIDSIKNNYPFFLLQASGPAVGLPPLNEGNSETGHLTIGSGRIIKQHLTVINEALKNGSFFENKIFLDLLEHVQKNGSKLHLLGLLTSGTVHASFEHFLAIIKFLKNPTGPIGSVPVFLHLFTDGKDSGQKESRPLLGKLEKAIAGSNIRVASLIGRNFAMDRDNNWKLTEKTYNLLVKGEGLETDNFRSSLEQIHSQGVTDEFVPPLGLGDGENLIGENDGVLFLNFREDSARQLTKAFTDRGFELFQTEKFNNLSFATMTNYDKNIKANPLFERTEIKNTLAEVLKANNLKQLHIAETLKYAHVIYFFNGLNEEKFEGETDLLIPSDEKYYENPGMKANEIADKVIEALRKKSHDFIVLNFANPDMLSHTGSFDLTVQGIEAVDNAIGKIISERPILIITGDHGNAENLTYQGTGEKESRHNLNPVPFYLVAEKFKKRKAEDELATEEKEIKGMLQDIAPTILKLMDLKKPEEMTGISLI